MSKRACRYEAVTLEKLGLRLWRNLFFKILEGIRFFSVYPPDYFSLKASMIFSSGVTKTVL